MRKIIRKIVLCRLFCSKKEEDLVSGDTRKLVIEQAKQKRQEANEKIDSMIAQINGCGDRWFLQPMQTLDECPPPENGSDN